MNDFQLDTSGYVDLGGVRGIYYFAALTPFTQGYVEALFKDNPGGLFRAALGFAFSDLAPETLARIIDDCEAQECLMRSSQKLDDIPGDLWRDTGSRWWGQRSKGSDRDFPPLTPYLGDDGKVYLREPSQ